MTFKEMQEVKLMSTEKNPEKTQKPNPRPHKSNPNHEKEDCNTDMSLSVFSFFFKGKHQAKPQGKKYDQAPLSHLKYSPTSR